MKTNPAVRREVITAIVWFVLMVAGCLIIGLGCQSDYRWDHGD